jgi:D-alanyl-D-alanine carboxypeptidase
MSVAYRSGACRLLAVYLAVSVASLAAASADDADAKSRKSAPAPNYASIVVDAKTGKVLDQSNADARRYPASLTKMMTLYLLFEAIERKEMSLTTPLSVSAQAAAQPPSKLGLKAGETIAVKDAILAVVTRSANDVAVVIAENLAGSEAAFAARMTATARAIGMSNTTFRNASGLPDAGQVSTARDMAQLGRALQERFPKEYRYFATRSFIWKGKRIGNHNRLLGRVAGVDGIKTGYTRASGFNLVTSVNRDKRHVVAVVMGGKTGKSRDAHMASLIEKNFRKASRGQKTDTVLVASAAPAPSGSKTMVMIPRPRPETATIALALAAAPQQPDLAEPVRALDAPLPAIAPAKAELASDIIGELALAQGDIDEDLPGPRKPAVDDSWKIQIGALPSKSAALSALAKARKAAPTVLAYAEPYAEAVDAKGATLYRARFGGFDSKEAARSACVKLASKDFACLALQ